MFKKALKAGAFAAALALPGFAFAQAAPAADAKPADAKPADAKPEEPKPPYTLYRQRGFVQPIHIPRTEPNQRKPRDSGRFRLLLQFRSSHSSTPAPGRRTSAGSRRTRPTPCPAPCKARMAKFGSLESWDFYGGGYQRELLAPNDFVIGMSASSNVHSVSGQRQYESGRRAAERRQRRYVGGLRRALGWKWLTLQGVL